MGKTHERRSGPRLLELLVRLDEITHRLRWADWAVLCKDYQVDPCDPRTATRMAAEGWSLVVAVDGEPYWQRLTGHDAS